MSGILSETILKYVLRSKQELEKWKVESSHSILTILAFMVA